MKFKQLTRHVWAGYTYWPLPVMVWIVEDHDGLTLVDGGLPSMWYPMREALRTTFGGRPINRILLTHGHSDHIGMLYELTEEISVAIMAHEIEIPFLSGEKSYTTLREGSKNKDIKPFPKNKIEPLEMKGSYGGMIPYHTPGHSLGHVAFYHPEDRILLAGDLFTAIFGKLRRPIEKFTANMEESLQSGAIVNRLQPKLTACSHCGVVKEASLQYCKLVKDQTN
ncbi:glyoxylase-like metal-dependent hydrolase (beta-lactamase superfamily II) [Paenibacillus rhizosphaerae]|uniref:Glyoxylase-like metal-dependent hydrolase (Beta-lactamase superfamily II) n=1 Tax=Paenibacillus rhizosphaerae TaxID=297318 RepID=A0A839TPE2_9BACL|nr:MBL fold metallo-hydrolase [Paenibacillus rhizosphaerae]MBB3128686.1 glyoxylase-like metal-dependent hydrolase (beta-lactamase superfamily II) [Paenibacillus rhizosphaerae]